ncbi:MAG TPA: GPW/gp25 family protein [Flavobacteriales bacterium]|nr:GPW/gp25 family protein [Flavobacteriales bacterium]
MAELVSNIKSQNWSLNKDTQGEVVTDIEDINQCIYIIITTIKGTDPLRPTFGCGVWEHVDKPANVAVPNMIREIAKAIAEFEPRAEVQKITFELAEANVIFTIYWTSSFGNSVTAVPVTLT